ncbi:MAG: cytochrome c [Rubrivivax sp.]|nr:cytochrome c [Rubrivivax sp.]
MRRLLKLAGLALAALLGLAVLLALGARLWAEHKRQRVVVIAVAELPPLEGAAAVQRGRYLFESRGCANCHGLDGGGRVFAQAGDGTTLAGPNLTPGGAVASYGGRDWARAVRHGVAPGGRPLLIMPSDDYVRLTDADLGAIVAYLRQLPARSGGEARIGLPFVAWMAYGFGLMRDASERVDHSVVPAEPVAEAVSVEHGAYVASLCVGCHGAGLEGGRVPGNPPHWPPAARLAPGAGSVMASYPDAESLRRLFRTGLRADGSRVAVMPFESLARLSEVDVQALHLYLRGGGTTAPSTGKAAPTPRRP